MLQYIEIAPTTIGEGFIHQHFKREKGRDREREGGRKQTPSARERERENLRNEKNDCKSKTCI